MEEVSEKKKKIEIVFDKIKKGITEIIKSGEYEKFLKFSKNFHSYSFNNRVLIYIQMPTATKVAGFKTWQKMERKIKYGAKGIQIIYPIKQKYEKKVLDNDDYSWGYDAKCDKFCNLVDAGILDATKVVRCALENGSSIAGSLLTVEGLIIDDTETNLKLMSAIRQNTPNM